MTGNTETKSQRFRRLLDRRMTRALEELRLVGRLSSPNYENTPEEAENLVLLLDQSLRSIATAFDVEYASRVGRGASNTTNTSHRLSPFKKVSILDEIDIARALEHLRAGRNNEVEQILRSALISTP